MARFDPIKLAPSPNDDGVVECWSSLKNINGCVKGVYKVFTGVGWLDSSCCEVVNKIDNKCWPKIFPFNPSFGYILMYYCSIVTAPTSSIICNLKMVWCVFLKERVYVICTDGVKNFYAIRLS
ncbi:uncharacterized protein [Solanum tuberosum]|uniref:uncharacterized protein n=1 Tax=Solanum tuberosum TaxID=4113 RepID=UPI0003D247C9|nr:PREDICTED: uncharacterized protein LOC102583612 [Solanum tuberosum]